MRSGVLLALFGMSLCGLESEGVNGGYSGPDIGQVVAYTERKLRTRGRRENKRSNNRIETMSPGRLPRPAEEEMMEQLIDLVTLIASVWTAAMVTVILLIQYWEDIH